VTVREGRHRRRRCRACGWIFYDNPLPAANGLIVRAGRLLLGRRARPPYPGMWDIPGGFLESGETPEQGLRRELREELGATVRRMRWAGGAADRYGRDGCPVLSILFWVTLAPGPLRPADDVAELRWFAIDQLPFRRIAFASTRRMLRALLGNGTRRSLPRHGRR
jgi:ADP-ribose pyrophosphatase YjhB (NUDIX family)